MEVLTVGEVKYRRLPACLAASIVGDIVCRTLGARHGEYGSLAYVHLGSKLLIALLAFGLLCGMASRLFVAGTHAVERFLQFENQSRVDATGDRRSSRHCIDLRFPNTRVSRSRPAADCSGLFRRRGLALRVAVKNAIHGRHHRLRLQGRRGHAAFRHRRNARNGLRATPPPSHGALHRRRNLSASSRVAPRLPSLAPCSPSSFSARIPPCPPSSSAPSPISPSGPVGIYSAQRRAEVN